MVREVWRFPYGAFLTDKILNAISGIASAPKENITYFNSNNQQKHTKKMPGVVS